MTTFAYRDGVLFGEEVDLRRVVKEVGTPVYIYSGGHLRRMVTDYQEAFARWSPLVAFAVKANSNLSVIREAGRAGAGADIVSGGELARALKAGIPASKIVYAGVGKSPAEMRRALDAGIKMFNVESIAELELLNTVAGEAGTKAPIAVRVNPDVDPRTHEYVATGKKESKFGLDLHAAREAYKRAMDLPHIEPVGIHMHIGSQLTALDPFVEALGRLTDFVEQLREMGLNLSVLDIGGGIGITYNDEIPPRPEELAAVLGPHLNRLAMKELVLEPGRSVTGEGGVLITSLLYRKETESKTYLIIDGAMNDLVRPSLYGAFHQITPLEEIAGRPNEVADVVGPVCESGDFFAKARRLPRAEAGEQLVVHSAGAYGFVMSSNYNTRPRAAEVLIDGKNYRVVRRRETVEDLMRLELEALES